MNVEMIATLDQIRSNLSMAKSIAKRRLSPVDFLLMRIDVVLQDIDETIRAEEDAMEAYYQEVQSPKLAKELKPNNDFNPIFAYHANSISKAFNNCWVALRASKRGSATALSTGSDGGNPEYSISIQPLEYTRNDVLLKLRSLGYEPTFKKFMPASMWVCFDVVENGFAFELHSTVSSLEPPELERYSEPATD